MKKITKIILLLIVLTASVYSQFSLPLRLVKSDGTPSTGKADSIKFTRYPHGFPTNIISALTITEVGTAGNYRCRGFTTFEFVKLWVNGVEQTWFDSVQVGDLKAYLTSVYAKLAANNTITGSNTFSGSVNLFTNDVIVNDDFTVEDPRIKTTSPFYANPDVDNLVTRNWVETNFSTSGVSLPINDYRVWVDSKQPTDFTNKVYNTITEAIAFAVGWGITSTDRFTIYIIPHHSTGYAENVKLYRYINLVGVGNVTITGNFTTTHFTAEETWTGYDSRIENLSFIGTNTEINVGFMNVDNCLFKLNGTVLAELNIDGCQFRNCGFYGLSNFSLSIVNSVKINRVKDCYGGSSFSWTASDKIYSYDVVESDVWE